MKIKQMLALLFTILVLMSVVSFADRETVEENKTIVLEELYNEMVEFNKQIKESYKKETAKIKFELSEKNGNIVFTFKPTDNFYMKGIANGKTGLVEKVELFSNFEVGETSLYFTPVVRILLNKTPEQILDLVDRLMDGGISINGYAITSEVSLDKYMMKVKFELLDKKKEVSNPKTLAQYLEMWDE